MASGDVSDYGETEGNAIATVFAKEAGVSVGAVTVTVTSASVNIAVTIATSDAASVETALSDVLANADAATTFLQTAVPLATVTAEPSISSASLLHSPPLPPQPLRPQAAIVFDEQAVLVEGEAGDTGASMLMPIVGAVVGVAAVAALLLALFLRRRAKLRRTAKLGDLGPASGQAEAWAASGGPSRLSAGSSGSSGARPSLDSRPNKQLSFKVRTSSNSNVAKFQMKGLSERQSEMMEALGEDEEPSLADLIVPHRRRMSERKSSHALIATSVQEKPPSWRSRCSIEPLPRAEVLPPPSGMSLGGDSSNTAPLDASSKERVKQYRRDLQRDRGSKGARTCKGKRHSAHKNAAAMDAAAIKAEPLKPEAHTHI